MLYIYFNELLRKIKKGYSETLFSPNTQLGFKSQIVDYSYMGIRSNTYARTHTLKIQWSIGLSTNLVLKLETTGYTIYFRIYADINGH